MEDSPAAVLDMLGLVYRSILNDVDNRQLNILAVVLLNRLGVADLSFEVGLSPSDVVCLERFALLLPTPGREDRLPFMRLFLISSMSSTRFFSGG